MNKSLISLFYDTLKPNLTKSNGAHTFKPSSLGSKCLRKVYYDYFRVLKDFDVNESIKKMGKLGSGMHEVLSSAFRESGSLIDYVTPEGNFDIVRGIPNLEFPITSPELHIKKGYIDAVVIIDGKLWLGEYKTCTAKSFTSLKKPKPDHLIQGAIYLFVFNKMLKEGHFKHIPELDKFDKVEGIRFLYVDRDNAVHFQMKEFVVNETIAQPVFLKVVEKIIKVKGYVDTKELPPRTPDWCQSCPYRAKCSKNFNI